MNDNDNDDNVDNHENDENSNNANSNSRNENGNHSNNISDNCCSQEEDDDDIAAMKRAAIAGVTATVTTDSNASDSDNGSDIGSDNDNGNPPTSPAASGTSELPVVPAVCVEIDQDVQPPTPAEIERLNKTGRRLVGKKVQTTFGTGVVLDFRSRDGVYEIQIENHKGSGSNTSTSTNTNTTATTTLYSVQVPELCVKSPAEIANQLNVAYEALEKMRRLNLDVQCYELGIHCAQVDYDMCTACLLAHKGSTKSHFPRLQKLVDSAHVSTQDFNSQVQGDWKKVVSSANALDHQIQDKLPGLHRFFNPKPAASFFRPNYSSSSTASASSSSAMASRISASLQEASTIHSNATSTVTTAVTTTLATVDAAPSSSSSSSSFSASVPAGSSPNDSNERNNNSENPTTTTTAAAETQNNHVPATTNKKTRALVSASTASAKPPTTRTNPSSSSVRKLWTSLQSLPQPVSPKNQSSNSNSPSTLAVSTNTKMAASAAATASSSSSVAQKFPGFRGLILNNAVTTTIFGENKVKEEGSSADPNVIMHNRIGGLSTTVSPKPVPVKSNKPIALPRIQRLINKRTQANTSPCLICASPSCASCSSTSFRKEGITLCLKCERLFELDFIVDCVSTSDATQRAERIEYMVDCYDRCMLLLQYSKQFVENIASSLEDQMKKQDKIGLASSSVGILSGVLGIAAAASILTPAGPPLLIASLFFGGSATTVQSGTEALNYLSEPRKLADRIIALHGMSLSILRVTSTLRDAMLRDHIRTDVYEVEPAAITNQVKQTYEKNKTNIVMGSNFGRSLTMVGGLARAEAGAAVGASSILATEMSAVGATTASAAGARGATALSRAGTAAARTVRFARFAGGALSAAVLVMEANAIHSTVNSIKEGSPCDKADTLRKVLEEIEEFPSTTDLDEECQAYLTALAARPEPPIEVDAVSDDYSIHNGNDEILEASCQQVQDGQLSAPGATILEGVSETQLPNINSTEGPPTAAAVPVSASSGSSSFLGGSSSLFSRLQSRREDRRAAASEVVAIAVDEDQIGESNFSLVL
jgi:hypothetical protein